MFKHYSLRIKLSMAFLSIAILVAVVGYYQISSTSHIQAVFSDITDKDTGRAEVLEKAKITAMQLQEQMQLYKNGQYSLDIALEKANIATLSQALNGHLSQYRTLLAQDAEEFDDVSLVDELVKEAGQLSVLANGVLEAAHAQSPTTLAEAQQAFEGTSTKLNNDLTVMTNVEAEHISAQNTEVTSAVGRLINISILTTVAVIVLAIFLGLFVSGTISRSLSKLEEGAERLANGDFSQRIPIKSRDEIGQLGEAFNVMAGRLRGSYQRLAFETERDRILLESIGEGLITIDEKTNVVLINSKAMELLELDKQQIAVGVSVNSIFAIYDQEDTLVPIKQTPAAVVLKTAASMNDVFGFHKKNGDKLQINISANPVVVNEKVAGAIMTLRDVTKEKEVDRMKTEFISLASHQLRTPLSAIRWFVEMLLAGDAGKLQPEQQDFAQNISDSTDRMIALVNALLNISRIESGRIMIVPKPTDLGELVKGIINDLKAKTEEKQQTLIISVHADLPKIKLDPQLVGQVYLNLLTNAIKYTPKGGEISVFISKKDGQVISQITDNGYGIPKEQQDRVFQKFFRAANAVKVETDGTGLGLYLIKAVVESSGGKIWFESEENKGTTFWFSIPLSGMKAKKGEVTLDA